MAPLEAHAALPELTFVAVQLEYEYQGNMYVTLSHSANDTKFQGGTSKVQTNA